MGAKFSPKDAEQISGLLTQGAITELHRQATLGDRRLDSVAEDFLIEHGVLKRPLDVLSR